MKKVTTNLKYRVIKDVFSDLEYYVCGVNNIYMPPKNIELVNKHEFTNHWVQRFIIENEDIVFTYLNDFDLVSEESAYMLALTISKSYFLATIKRTNRVCRQIIGTNDNL